MAREFDVQRDHAGLLRRVADLLEPGGSIVFSNNNQRFKLDPALEREFEVNDLTSATLPEDFRRNPRIHSCFELRPRAASSPAGADLLQGSPSRRRSRR
jgi:23S rRNA (guanine2445-N2)-methyltransferase / 23S rRNA (guanine2069-N7)-methyltransferase